MVSAENLHSEAEETPTAKVPHLFHKIDVTGQDGKVYEKTSRLGHLAKLASNPDTSVKIASVFGNPKEVSGKIEVNSEDNTVHLVGTSKHGKEIDIRVFQNISFNIRLGDPRMSEEGRGKILSSLQDSIAKATGADAAKAKAVLDAVYNPAKHQISYNGVDFDALGVKKDLVLAAVRGSLGIKETLSTKMFLPHGDARREYTVFINPDPLVYSATGGKVTVDSPEHVQTINGTEGLVFAKNVRTPEGKYELHSVAKRYEASENFLRFTLRYDENEVDPNKKDTDVNETADTTVEPKLKNAGYITTGVASVKADTAEEKAAVEAAVSAEDIAPEDIPF